MIRAVTRAIVGVVKSRTPLQTRREFLLSHAGEAAGRTFLGTAAAVSAVSPQVTRQAMEAVDKFKQVADKMGKETNPINRRGALRQLGGIFQAALD